MTSSVRDVTVWIGPSPAAGEMRSLAVRDAPAVVAVTVASTANGTVSVRTLNVTAVAPAAIVNVAGTRAASWLLESVTTAPPAGAAAESVAVP